MFTEWRSCMTECQDSKKPWTQHVMCLHRCHLSHSCVSRMLTANITVSDDRRLTTETRQVDALTQKWNKMTSPLLLSECADRRLCNKRSHFGLPIWNLSNTLKDALTLRVITTCVMKMKVHDSNAWWARAIFLLKTQTVSRNDLEVPVLQTKSRMGTLKDQPSGFTKSIQKFQCAYRQPFPN